MINQSVMNLMMELITFSFVIPVAFIAVWKMRVRDRLLPVFVGIGAYLIFAELFQSVPDSIFLASETSLAHSLGKNVWLMALYTALTAALLQGVGRYAAFRFVIKEDATANAAVSFGLGFGCMGCIFSLGIENLRNYSFAQMINNNQVDELLKTVDAATAASYQKLIGELTATSRVDLLLNGVEQFTLFFLQIALAVLVYYAVRQSGQRRMIWVSMGLQALILYLNAFALAGIVPRLVVVLSMIILTIGVAQNAYHYYKNDSTKVESKKESDYRDGWNYANKRYHKKEEETKENTDL